MFMKSESNQEDFSDLKKTFQEMKLFTGWLFAGVAFGQEEYSDYPDYAYEYNGGNGARPPTTTSSPTTSGGTTTEPTTADYTTTEAAPAEYEAEPDMANDFVQPVAEAEEPTEAAEGDAAGLGRLNMDQFWFPVGKDEGGAETTPVYVPPVSRLDGELLADGDIQLAWDLNSAAHDS